MSASGAKKWLTCPPSARLEEGLPDGETEYAKEGKLAHAMAELKVLRYLERITPQKFTADLKKLRKDPAYTKEMDTHTDAFLEHVRRVIHSYPSPPHVAVEQRIDYSMYAPEGFGTGDIIIAGSGWLDVIDLKYGKGVPVAAEDNPQLKLYGLGALDLYSMLLDLQRVRCTIFQPRLDNNSTWEISADELRAWGEWVKPVGVVAFAGGGEFCPGDHCQFCRVSNQCRARADHYAALENFGGRLPPLLTNEEIAEVLRRGKNLVSWIEKVEEFALAEALKGGTIPGYKVVEGRSNRKFTDVDQVFGVLKAAGYDEALLYNREPITLTAVETLLKKGEFNTLLAPYIVKAPGKPTLVLETDNRKPYSEQTIEDDFKNWQANEATNTNEALNAMTPDQADQVINNWAVEAAQPVPGFTPMPTQLGEDIKKYYGLAPYNTPANTLKGDGFYGSYIRNTYPREQIERCCNYLGIATQND